MSLSPAVWRPPTTSVLQYLEEVTSSWTGSSLLPTDVSEEQRGRVSPATRVCLQPCAQIGPCGYGSLNLAKQQLLISFRLCRKLWDLMFSFLCLFDKEKWSLTHLCESRCSFASYCFSLLWRPRDEGHLSLFEMLFLQGQQVFFPSLPPSFSLFHSSPSFEKGDEKEEKASLES